MIQLTFFENSAGRLIAFTANGHAEYAPPGEPDILCAAVTAWATGVIGALQDEVRIPLEYRAEEGALYCRIKENEGEAHKQEEADLLFRSMRLACEQIRCTYGAEYIHITKTTCK